MPMRKIWESPVPGFARFPRSRKNKSGNRVSCETEKAGFWLNVYYPVPIPPSPRSSGIMGLGRTYIKVFRNKDLEVSVELEGVSSRWKSQVPYQFQLSMSP